MTLDLTRLDGLIDTKMLAGKTLMVIGTGGVAGATLSLARYGVGTIVLIDQDVVSATNISTSDFPSTDIGMPKVESLKRRIHDINLSCNVKAIQSRFEDTDAGTMADASLVWSMTDDVMSTITIDDIAVAAGKDVLHAAMHADNRACDIIGSLTPESAAVGGWRDFAATRISAHEAGRARPAFFPSHVVSANALNNKIEWLTLGLLHHRAGSKLPIAEHGALFAKSPCMVFRLDPTLWQEPHQVFGGVPPSHTAFASLQVFRSPGSAPAA
ncbi:HesA/MoeB/ThiF family protein [Bosea sp. (in: a-proteobacteria)]|uniref:HesA/MoeB/ThiF family protein n=1 Tax=Bosea sp. (in: a-proteobacteria) TaxID=1871050 RepID=UPI002B482A1A|nr:ThiF family adenylyltransferase [Bosea sp. (in: a-proteobacteria)]WRH58475.1 MAG: ThiF family adenylyltransferase [Bosea sp. (in: a-proteobacteria)]